ncbi:MAG TPA: flagellar biosynthesis anti-sigma factor FlgM [Bdellovibrionota bacterium]|jgi:flagellar biosynthesis anti-sigma factor FlgM
MKVSNNKDSVDLSQVSHSKKGGKAGKARPTEESAGSAGASAFGGTANVELSSEAKAMAAANGIAKTEETDEAKIARVKAMIGNGTYKPDYGKVADKMINEQLLQETS